VWRGTNDLENKSYHLDTMYIPMVNPHLSLKYIYVPSSIEKYNLDHNLVFFLADTAPNVSDHVELVRIQVHVCATELRYPFRQYQMPEQLILLCMFGKVVDYKNLIVFSIHLKKFLQKDTMFRCSVV